MTEQTITSYVTMYGFPDNDPPGSAIIAQPVMHKLAGGIGTFNDPITFASDAGVIPFGTRIYVPYLHKYFIMEDICAEAVQNPGVSHVDLWAGGDASTNVSALLDANTRDAARIIVNPDPGHPVNVTPFAPGDTHFATLAPHLRLSSGDFLVLGQPGNAHGADLDRARRPGSGYSTVTDFARLRGWSTSVPMTTAVW